MKQDVIKSLVICSSNDIKLFITTSIQTFENILSTLIISHNSYLYPLQRDIVYKRR